ncbi:MAG: site-2 protease family protein, partial [Anaerolineae bacterium]|nr:site-2 protease family protein [Anaerolineae bacterium]
MLHEPAAQPDYFPRSIPKPESDEKPGQCIAAIRGIVGQYLEITEEHFHDALDLPAEDQAIVARGAESKLLVSFVGTLRDDSAVVYEALEEALQPQDQYALLRENRRGTHPHLIHIVAGRPTKPRDLPVWPNALLFLATLLSVLYTGTTIAIAELSLDHPVLAQELGSSLGSILANLWRGWPYALSILLILVPHEMGHFLMMRRHKVAASWPYFLPGFFISPFGTFGAAILLRESLKNRKTLLDVGASGPIAGFLVAVPLVFIGLATSRVLPMTGEGLIEGNSLIYAFAKWVIFGEVLPNGQFDV